MSNKNKIAAANTSATIKQSYDQVCFLLGQEIANERRAQENQDRLKDQQKVLEEAFNKAKSREDESAAAKERDAQRKKAELDRALAEEAKKQADAALNVPTVEVKVS